jgi:alkylation response protein AidB-like acyl-CoA dehydrogenase
VNSLPGQTCTTGARSGVTAESVEDYRDRVRSFLTEQASRQHATWVQQGMVPREFWEGCGAAGMLVPAAPPELGGRGVRDPHYTAAVAEELVRCGVTVPGVVAHNDVGTSYLLDRATPEQQQRWLPDLCSGRTIAAIAITEPGGGSDVGALTLTASRDGTRYLLNGRKSFITNGGRAGLLVVAARTGDGPAGISLLVVDGASPGLERGPQLPALGWPANDLCDLTFEDCSVPAENLLGTEGSGAAALMRALPRERLSIAVVAVAAAERTLRQTCEHARSRRMFGTTLGDLQQPRFTLATLDTEVTIARVFLDHCLRRHAEGRLSVTDAAKAKWWTTELQIRVADAALQLHGGRGYLHGNDISREWLDSRVQAIYGGPTEVMKDMIGRSLGL